MGLGRTRITEAVESDNGWYITVGRKVDQNVHELTYCEIEPEPYRPGDPRCNRCGQGEGIEVDSEGWYVLDHHGYYGPARNLYADEEYCLCGDCLKLIAERLETAEWRRVKKWARGS